MRLVLPLFVVALLAVTPAQAQDAYPSKPIRMVVATPPGGASDTAARVLAEALRNEIGQSVVVENRAGASGTIGAAYVAKAPADGYTLFWGTGSTHIVAPAMMKGVPYDPIKDFTPIALVGRAPFVLLAGPSLQANTLPEIIALAKQKPGQLAMGTTGTATIYEVAALALESLGGVKFNHVPYKGFGPMLLDLIGGRIDLMVGPADNTTLNDKVRTIAALGTKRLPSRPDAPAAGESGYGDFDVPVWAAIFAPANTPKPVVEHLNTALQAAMKRPEVKERIGVTGINVEGGDDAVLRKVMAQDYETIKRLMKNAGVEPQ
jgi:tripartite-type tricarboxylate transporter receptor subunit TctC